MILKEAHISGFGRYSEEEIKFSEGINVIYGENGSGKSTLHQFLRSMLFGLERGRGKAARTDTYTHYSPWAGGSYGGSLLLEAENGDILIERNLSSGERSLTVRQPDTGHVLTTEQDALRTMLGGLSEEAYRNTISIEQLKVSTDSGLEAQLTNHLSSITMAGNSSLNITGAMAQLAAQKKQLKKQIDWNAPLRYDQLQGEISEKERQLSSMNHRADDLDERLRSLEKQIDDRNRKREALTEDIDATAKAIEEHSMSAYEDIALYQIKIHETYTAYHLDRLERKGSSGGSFRPRDVVIGLLAFLIFAGLGLATMFFEQLPLGGMTFPYPKLPFELLFFGASTISLLFMLVRLIRSKKMDAEAAQRADETTRFLSEELRTHLGTEEITEQNINRLLAAADEYQTLNDHLGAAKLEREDVLSRLVGLQNDFHTLEEEMNTCRQEAWEYEQGCRELSGLENKKAELLLVLEENKRLERQFAAVVLAEDTISAISTSLHESASPALNARVSEILYQITDGIYDRLFIDNDLSITIRQNGRSIPLSSLSRGTIEQVYLALRIAAVELLYPELSLPLLLDDTFSYYDDNRLQNTLRYLAENYPGQVLLFTCHKREAAFLSRMDAAYRLIPLT